MNARVRMFQKCFNEGNAQRLKKNNNLLTTKSSRRRKTSHYVGRIGSASSSSNGDISSGRRRHTLAPTSNFRFSRGSNQLDLSVRDSFPFGSGADDKPSLIQNI